ncbi:hypothetical protein BC332_23351 [Capsicum chinense]|nr:hypothetical protein BC332_23351 [Capsicum chinense]
MHLKPLSRFCSFAVLKPPMGYMGSAPPTERAPVRALLVIIDYICIYIDVEDEYCDVVEIADDTNDDIEIKDAATPNMFLGNTEIIKNEVKEHTPIETSSIAESSATEKKVPANVLSKSRPESESRIQMLEEELKEAPAIEVALYSIATKHGSLMNKVPTPARRLARFYLHAWRTKSSAKQASTARACVSGLALVYIPKTA